MLHFFSFHIIVSVHVGNRVLHEGIRYCNIVFMQNTWEMFVFYDKKIIIQMISHWSGHICFSSWCYIHTNCYHMLQPKSDCTLCSSNWPWNAHLDRESNRPEFKSSDQPQYLFLQVGGGVINLPTQMASSGIFFQVLCVKCMRCNSLLWVYCTL